MVDWLHEITPKCEYICVYCALHPVHPWCNSCLTGSAEKKKHLLKTNEVMNYVYYFKSLTSQFTAWKVDVIKDAWG